MSVPDVVRAVLLPLLHDLRRPECPCGEFQSLREGCIPRGFYGAHGGIAQVDLVVVGRNPSRPQTGEGERYERALAAGGPSGVLDEMDAFCMRILADPAKGTKGLYQRGLLSLLRQCLETDDLREIGRRTYFTQMYKCSLPAGPTARIERRRLSQCVSRSLLRELDALPHVPILALGREVEAVLTNAGLGKRTVYAHHPSYYMKHSCRASHEDAARAVKALLAEKR